jgi:hypothetical protein
VKGEKMIGIASAQVRRAIHSGTATTFHLSPFTFHASPPAAGQDVHADIDHDKDRPVSGGATVASKTAPAINPDRRTIIK